MKTSQEQKILEILARLEARMATKDDLKGFATKEDIASIRMDMSGFATKEDIASIRMDMSGFATKDDLKGFATKDDLLALENRLMTHIDRLAGNYMDIEEMFIILGQRTCDNEVEIHRIKTQIAMT